MHPLRFLLLATSLVIAHEQAFSQTPRWESMDGPYRPETRTHLRFPDGDRRYYGSNTGMHHTTDGGATWKSVSSVPALNLTVYESPTGKLIGHCQRHVQYVWDGVELSYDSIYTSSDHGAHWTYNRGHTSHGMFYWFMNAFGGGDTVYQTGWDSTNFNSSAPLLLRSTDGGITWTEILRANWNILALFVQSNNLFVLSYATGVDGTMLRSTDGGTSWQSFDADTVVFNPPNSLLRHSSDLQQNYARLPRPYLELSTDDGVTWTPTLGADSGFGSIITNNSGTVLVLKYPGPELSRSTDGGFTWTSLGSGPSGDTFWSVAFYGKTHLIGKTRGGGIYRSTDYGTNWSVILDPGGAPLTGNVQSASDSLFVVADRRGSWIESTDAGGTWRSISCTFEKEQVASLLSLPSGSLFAGTVTGLSKKKGEELWSDHTGSTVWSLYYPSGPYFFMSYSGSSGYGEQASVARAYDTSYVSGTASFVKQWVVMAPLYSLRTCQCLFVSTAGMVFGSCEGKLYGGRFDEPWDYQHLIFSAPSWQSAIVEDSTHTLWLSNDSVGLYRSTDQGLNWIGSNGDLSNKKIISMSVAPNGNIFVGSRADGLFCSTDSGATWNASGLSGERVQVLAVGPRSEVYAGTPNGVRLSTDGGLSWIDISTDLQNKDVRALAVGADGTLYCGTWGDGVYRLVGALIEDRISLRNDVPLTYRLEQNYPNPFNPRTVIRSQTPEVSNVRIVIYDLLGREVKALVNERRAAGRYQDSFDASGLSSGIYIYRMSAGKFSQSRKMLLVK